MARDAIVPPQGVTSHDGGSGLTPVSSTSAGRPARLVRIEEPLALFAPERYITSTVPLPLYLLELVPGSVKADYEKTETGIVANENDRIRRRTLRYPGGVRCDVEVHGDQVRGLPTTFDYDYFLALCRIADAGGVDREGYFIDPGYRAVLRAAGRPDEAIGGDQVEAVKRAFARFAGLVIHTKLDVDYAAVGEQVRSGGKGPLVPDGTPALRERESKHWVLEYDVEAERQRTTPGGATTFYNAIERLRINPIWLNQAAAGIAAWLDIDLHNALRSSYAKRLLQLFTVRAARGWRVLEPWVLSLRELYGLLEVPASYWPKSQTRTGVIAALDTLAEHGVLGSASVTRLGKGNFEVRLSAGERLLAAGLQRGSGLLDSPADRTLLWHLRAVGFSPTQARDLVRRRPDQVRTVLRRAYFLQAVKGGLANGRPVEDWNAWVRAAIEGEWAFADPEWQRWLATQIAAAEQGRLDGPLADLTLLGGDGIAARSASNSHTRALPQQSTEARNELGRSHPAESAAIEYVDDPWGRAVATFVAEHGDPRIYASWLARTALDRITDTTVEVTAEDGFVAEWVAKKYGERLATILSESSGRPLELRLSAEGKTGASHRSTGSGADTSHRTEKLESPRTDLTPDS